MTLSAELVELRVEGIVALSKVSAEVVPGRVTALAGPNGAGKSSLLRLLSGELEPSSGMVRLDGAPLAGIPPAELALRRSVMGQVGTMAFDYYVEEVLAMGLTQDSGAARLEVPLAEVAEQCQVHGLFGRKFNTLSGGERQRVHFARTLLQIWRAPGNSGARGSARSGATSRYMLLDEPTANLDLANELLVLRLACCASKRDVGVLVVLHDLNLAARFADVVLLLDKGTVCAAGPPQAVFKEAKLSEVYRTPMRVEWHQCLDRLVIHTL